MSFIVPKSAEIDTEDNLITNLLGASYMGLISTYFAVDADTVLTDCTGNEASFTGYSRSAMTSWSTPAIDGDSAAATTSTGTFTPTAAGGTGNIYGYFLTNSAGTKFYGAETFSTPISAPQAVTLAMELTYTVLSRY